MAEEHLPQQLGSDIACGFAGPLRCPLLQKEHPWCLLRKCVLNVSAMLPQPWGIALDENGVPLASGRDMANLRGICPDDLSNLLAWSIEVALALLELLTESRPKLLRLAE